jgi:integrase
MTGGRLGYPHSRATFGGPRFLIYLACWTAGRHGIRRATWPPFKRTLPQPQALTYEVIRTTFDKMRPNPTKARLMLMAYAGFRPSEIQRALPDDVHLDVAEPHCYKRVGKGGRSLMVPLPLEGVEAWKLFIRTEAWGEYARGAANRHWQAAMKRAGYMPTPLLYAPPFLRHTASSKGFR